MITSNLLGEKLEFIFCSMEKIWNSEEGIDIFGVNLFFFSIIVLSQQYQYLSLEKSLL